MNPTEDRDRRACGCTERYVTKHGHHGPACTDETTEKCSAEAHADASEAGELPPPA